MIDIKKVEKQLKEAAKKIENSFLPIQEQLRVMTKPVKEKNFIYNGKNAVISQLEDGRIMIRVSDTIDTEKYYEETPCYTQVDMDKLRIDINKEWRNKPWHKRIWL